MRIGINVPDDLLDKVKEVLPAGKVSQFFRDALQDRIKEEQRVKERVRDDGLDAEIAQLARGTELPQEPDWEGLAWDNAASWIKQVTPEDWNELLDLLDERRKEGKSEDIYVGLRDSEYEIQGITPRLMKYEKELWRAAPPSARAKLVLDAKDRCWREYNRAWLGYVYEVRRLIEQRRKEQYERLLTELDAAHRARPGPEVPEHLV